MRTFLDICAVVFVLLVLPLTVVNVSAGLYVGHRQHRIDERQEVLEAKLNATRFGLRNLVLELQETRDSLREAQAALANQKWQYLQDCE